MRRLLIALSCAAPLEPTNPAEPEQVGGACETPAEDGATCSEDIGEAADALNGCRELCIAANAIGCGAVGAACLLGDVLSIGTLTLPCAFAFVAACYSAGTGGQCDSLCGGG